MTMYNMEALSIYDQCQFFLKLFKCQGQKIKYLQKDLITRDIHVKYQTLALTIQKLLARLNF